MIEFEIEKKWDKAGIWFTLLAFLDPLVGMDVRKFVVYGVTSDGARWELRSAGSEGDADLVVRAYEAQLEAAESPDTWAEEKGFVDLAEHLRATA